jgi:hypothetical protein
MLLLADVSSAVLTALIAMIVSALVTMGVNFYMNRGHNERMVYGLVQKIIEFSMTYPYLEDDTFCVQWPEIPDDPNSEKRQRYEHYCCHVFNTLERVHELSKAGSKRMAAYLYPDEMILRHRKWWKSDAQNTDGYDEEFRAFVNEVIARREKEEENVPARSAH